MKIALTLAAATAALLVSGCDMAGCSGAANNNAAGGSCGLHTTFFASRASSQPSSALRKS